jgi:hypothetical protein
MSAEKKTPFTVAAYLTARLIEIGIEHVFTIPGDYCAPFLDVLDATPGIERVPNINELGCGYAADGYARLKGAGAACVQYGVGTFSLLNCVAGSYVEFAPVAIISSSPNASSRLLEEHQNILFHHSTGDLRADQKVFEDVTVKSVVITNAGAAPAEIDSALTAMLTERRPVYIEVINNVWTQACREPAGKLEPIRAYSDPNSLAAAVAAARQMVVSAESPVFFFGVELQRFELQADAQRLVDLTRIPFTTTSLAKTVLDETQPLFAGTYAGVATVDGCTGHWQRLRNRAGNHNHRRLPCSDVFELSEYDSGEPRGDSRGPLVLSYGRASRFSASFLCCVGEESAATETVSAAAAVCAHAADSGTRYKADLRDVLSNAGLVPTWKSATRKQRADSRGKHIVVCLRQSLRPPRQQLCFAGSVGIAGARDRLGPGSRAGHREASTRGCRRRRIHDGMPGGFEPGPHE